MTPEQRKTFKDAEDAFRTNDDKYLMVKRTRNDLESLSYALQRGLSDGGAWAPFAEESVRQQLLSEVARCIEWIDDDGDSAPLLELSEKLAHFKKLGDPIKERACFYEEFPSILN